MSQTKKQSFQKSQKDGIFLALFAFITWGFLVIFFKLFDKDVSPYEIVAHRVVWSLLFLVVVLGVLNKFKSVAHILAVPRLRYLLLSSGLLIGASWCVFIYAVASNNIAEAALGNFAAPIFQMIGGFLFFHERLSIAGKAAFALVAIAVALQAVELGGLPFISVFVALSVAGYALIRKEAKVAAYEGLFIESLFLAPIAVAYIWLMPSHFGLDYTGLLLALNGVVTVVPLLAFTAATTRVDINTISLMQYITPTIALAIAVLIYHEPLAWHKIVSFGLIWLGISIVSIESLLRFRRKA